MNDPCDSSDENTDLPLSRRRTRAKIQPVGHRIKSFDFNEKNNTTRGRILLSAANATSDMDDDDEVDMDAAEIILRKSNDFDNMETIHKDNAYYKYVRPERALELVKQEPLKYVKFEYS